MFVRGNWNLRLHHIEALGLLASHILNKPPTHVPRAGVAATGEGGTLPGATVRVVPGLENKPAGVAALA